MLELHNSFEAFVRTDESQDARLLIVDDEPNVRTSIGRALSLMGYSVQEAGSGQEALTLLEQTPPDLMVLDMRFPDMDGLEVMRQARRIHPQVLIIILTGYATLESAIAAIRLEAVDYLCKPVDTHEIAATVTRTLEKHANQLRQKQLIEVLSETLDALRRAEMLPDVLNRSDLSSILPRALSGSPSTNLVCVPPLVLDCLKRRVTVEDNSALPIELTKGETAVLASLMSYPNQILSCQDLVYSAWQDQVNDGEAESVIRPHIFRLRRKLEADPGNPRLIQTVRRRGYTFVPPS